MNHRLPPRPIARLAQGMLSSLLALAAVAGASTAHASDKPARAVSIVVAGPAGGATDGVARLIAARMSVTLGQDVIVDNKAGAGGVIGTKFVAQAKPDGQTLLLGHIATNAIAPAVHTPRPYDPVADFESIGFIGSTASVLVVPAKGPATLKALLTPRGNDPISYGSTGIGGTAHLLGHVFAQTTAAPLLHVPYRGSPPALQDLVGGRINMMFATAGAVAPYLESGMLKPLAVAASQRSRFLPDVPTFKELNHPGVVQEGWFGLFAAAGTPAETVRRLNQHLNTALADPTVRRGLEQLFVEVAPPAGPENFKSFVQREAAHWAGVVASSGVRTQ
ncbi:Bug family tripartite tricarboxylate transporter substrate binding protein [Comamonas antarctica]|uniref:Tripartite tricarboxylate transporter substrate binding protein n=1 Tax=Comamonas antarctica TaxID=2743470 RepID=A0A6N1X6H9_9BURK|nr:tripartite tricarboxylate transporter substrate binding protein [Comamonas antarctica]QKV53682.1 tripartite tricarboxylate transporter substrate binding protein [Comamonas antarctica]